MIYVINIKPIKEFCHLNERLAAEIKYSRELKYSNIEQYKQILTMTRYTETGRREALIVLAIKINNKETENNASSLVFF